jgi:hypothetical protein
VLCQIAPAQRGTPNPAGAPSSTRSAASTYTRHAPERTLLYALVQAHYPDFAAQLAAQERPLPAYVREAFEAYLRCGVLEHGFLRVVWIGAARSGWWRSPASSAGSARAAAHAGWPSRRGTWWTTCSARARCGSGC